MVQVMERLAEVLWGFPIMVLLLITGVLATMITKAVQVRKLGASIRQVGKSMGRKAAGVSSFQAVCTALAATVGTGNVAGVAGAVALGGPGAIFWMWVSAFLGMATKYTEVVFALRYRVRGGDGQWLGGPMLYMERGLGWKWLGKLFALFAVFGSFGMGNLAQIHTISAAVQDTVCSCLPQWRLHQVALLTGGVAAAVVAVVTLGGARRIGTLMERVVPFLAVVYILGSLAVIFTNLKSLPVVFGAVFTEAFTPRAAIGGGMGTALRWGVSRGIFSNEAGLGSAPIAHAAAEAAPEEQGLFGIFEVFLDTIVLCTLTGITILVSGVEIPYGQPAGVELAADALAVVFGSWAPGLLAVCLSLLALATLISWNLYGAQCVAYLWGGKAVFAYRILYVFVTMFGAMMNLSAVWSIADVCNGLMALPNLTALAALFLSGKVWDQQNKNSREAQAAKGSVIDFLRSV